jgi:hypothetical protein
VWLPRIEAAVRIVFHLEGFKHGDIQPYSLSLYVSVMLSLDLVRAHEAIRGFRYSRVVACRPDTLIHKDVQLASYMTQTFVYHNNGNGGTGDMFFVMSSLAAERIACVPRFLLSMGHYDGMDPHSILFLPFLIPDITGLLLAEQKDKISGPVMMT